MNKLLLWEQLTGHNFLLGPNNHIVCFEYTFFYLSFLYTHSGITYNSFMNAEYYFPHFIDEETETQNVK